VAWSKPTYRITIACRQLVWACSQGLCAKTRGSLSAPPLLGLYWSGESGWHRVRNNRISLSRYTHLAAPISSFPMKKSDVFCQGLGPLVLLPQVVLGPTCPSSPSLLQFGQHPVKSWPQIRISDVWPRWHHWTSVNIVIYWYILSKNVTLKFPNLS